MAIYAVMKTGGKQYRVAPGDVVTVEKLSLAPGATVEISEVYLLANAQGVTVGNPTIANARVVAEVVEEGRHKKVVIFKKRRRKHYERTIGHRQYFTTLRISEIAFGDDIYKAATTASHPDTPKAIAAAPAQPPPKKGELTKANATKPVPAPNIPAQKETAPVKPERVAQPDHSPTVVPDLHGRNAESAGAQNQPSAKTPEPIIAAREMISPITLPGDMSPKSEIETAETTAAAPASGAGTARIIDTAPAAKPPVWEQKMQPEGTEAPADHKHRYWLAAGALIALLTGISFLLFGNLDKRAPENAIPVASEPQQNIAKPKPKQAVREVNIKKPVGGSAPSAPVRPPD